MDSESDFYYLQARYYDPAIGQFTSVDPMVENTDMPYAYTVGDPINTSDASGLCSWLGCIGAAVYAASQATGVCLRDPFGTPSGGITETVAAKRRSALGRAKPASRWQWPQEEWSSAAVRFLELVPLDLTRVPLGRLAPLLD